MKENHFIESRNDSSGHPSEVQNFAGIIGESAALKRVLREVEIVALIAQGMSNADIAAELYLSGNTLKSHVRNAYRKIGANTRSQAVIWALQHGFAPPEDERALTPMGG